MRIGPSRLSIYNKLSHNMMKRESRAVADGFAVKVVERGGGVGGRIVVTFKHHNLDYPKLYITYHGTNWPGSLFLCKFCQKNRGT